MVDVIAPRPQAQTLTPTSVHGVCWLVGVAMPAVAGSASGSARGVPHCTVEAQEDCSWACTWIGGTPTLGHARMQAICL